MKTIGEVLKKQLEKIIISREEYKLIENRSKEIIKLLEENIKKAKISAEIFVGGSFAKGTMIKKERYDVDIFVRFDQRYSEEEISKLLLKIVNKKAERIHGSRDYYSIKEGNIAFEVIPTVKIKKPSEAKNITDLSYFHVKYINNKIKKDKKLAEQIMLAKAFTHYAGCYGAESYINGFSGYATELFVVYYKSLEKMIKAFASSKEGEKIIIDIEKDYKNKEDILRNLNEAKLQSPIVLIDPTFKERNAAASLSIGTYAKFKEACNKFIKNPSEKFFIAENKEENFNNRYRSGVLNLELTTNRQVGDIAGTKLKKFYSYFIKTSERYFDIKDSLFVYDDIVNIGKILIVLEAKKEILFSGPPISMKEQLSLFKKEHKKVIIKNEQAFAYEKGFKSFKEFLSYFENKYSKTIEMMGVSEIKIIK